MTRGGSDNIACNKGHITTQVTNIKQHKTLCACYFIAALMRYLAIVLRARTAVRRVISFLRRSKKMGRQVGSSDVSSGPKWLKICPLEHKSCSIQ